MSYTRPTLGALVTRVIGDLASRTEGRAFLKHAVENVFGHVIAAVAHELHGGVAWLHKQLLPTDADIESLLRWGAMIDRPRLGGVRAGGGYLMITGTPDTVVEAGTRFVAPGNVIVVTLARHELVGGSIFAGVAALEPGAAGNVPDGASLTLLTPIAGVDATATLEEPLTGGSDLEQLERYRARVVTDLRETPRSGAPGDYERWAREVPGVTRAWEFPARYGLGTVALGFMMDDRVDPIPTGEDVTVVQNYLNARKPLDMRAVYVRAPIPKLVNMTLSVAPALQSVYDAVQDEVASLFRELGLEEELERSVLDEAISLAPGETSHEITAVSALVPLPWEILQLGTITGLEIA